MAARKQGSDKPGSGSSRKAAGARKKSGTGKDAAVGKNEAAAGKKKAAAGKKKATAKAASGARKPARTKAAGSERAKKASKASQAAAVNMGHVFALRPRVPTTFRQADFLEARRLLADESYDSITAAARAVAEKALELTQQPASRHGRRPGG